MTTPAHSGAPSTPRLLRLAMAQLVIFAAAALGASPSGGAADPFNGLRLSAGGLHPLFALQDLDGDNIPETVVLSDFSLLRHGPLSVSIRLSASHRLDTVFIPDSIAAAGLKARDVDGDHDLDLVLIAGFHRPGAVLLNDGAGGFQLQPQGRYVTAEEDDDPPTGLAAPSLWARQLPALPAGHDPAAVSPRGSSQAPAPRLAACRCRPSATSASRAAAGPVRTRAP